MTCKVAASALFLLAGSPSVKSQLTTSDFLPFAPGLQWTYDYSAVDDNRLDEYTVSDSGIAIYTVVSKDSSADSTIWGLREIRDLIHSYFSYAASDHHYSQSPLKDTTLFNVIEYSTGNHRLLRSQTPSQIWKSVFCLSPEFSDSSRFFRFFPFSALDTVTLTASTPKDNPYYFLTTTLQRLTGIASVEFSTQLAGGSWQTHHTLKSMALTSLNHSTVERLPADLNLRNNYPNPFNPQTTILFSTGIRQKVTVTIVDVLGRRVSTLFDRIAQPGEYSMTWDASSLAAGTYFCVARAPGVTRISKLLLVR